jgi:hypothetical protein
MRDETNERCRPARQVIVIREMLPYSPQGAEPDDCKATR